MLRAVDKIQKKSKQDIIAEYEKKGYSTEKLEKIIAFSEIHGTPDDITKKIDVTSLDSWDEITRIYDSLKNRNISNIRINLGIVRGLDYYSGIVFEAFDTTFDIGALVGGGRYDSLPEAFGRTDFGATGVAGGVERIILALENQDSKFKELTKRISVLYVPTEDMKNHAIKLASSLRDKGMFVNIDLNDKPLKKQMEQSIDSKFAVIVAPNEFSNGTVVLRNMLDRSEKQVKLEDIFSELS
jgi:histidyl-tRNA synthetase